MPFFFKFYAKPPTNLLMANALNKQTNRQINEGEYITPARIEKMIKIKQ